MIFEHVGVNVSDLNRSISFYIEVFGFNLLRKTTTSAYLYLNNDLLELTQSKYTEKKKVKSKPVEKWSNEMHGPIGLSHIGFRVDNMDKTIDRIKKLGGELVVPPYNFEPKIEYTADLDEDKLRRASKPPPNKRVWRIASFSDPDGVILEVIER